MWAIGVSYAPQPAHMADTILPWLTAEAALVGVKFAASEAQQAFFVAQPYNLGLCKRGESCRVSRSSLGNVGTYLSGLL